MTEPRLNEGEIAGLLREISAKLDALPAAIAAAVGQGKGPPPRRLSASDREALAKLRPAIFAAVGDRTWSLRELREHSELKDPAAVELRLALAAIGSPLKIGRLLRRGNRLEVAGYEIEANGECRDGVLWTVRKR